MSRMPHIAARAAAWIALAALDLMALDACTGLPPKPPPVVLPLEVPLTDLAGASPDGWPRAAWWQRYQDPTLDGLIDNAVATAPTLATAQSRFHAAREAVRQAGAATGAHVDFTGDVDRQRLSDNGVFPPQLLGLYWYNQADLGLAAAYTFDWWDKQRDIVQAAVDQAMASEAERSAAGLALASAVADAYFGWQADMNRVELCAERLAAAEREAAIAAARVRRQLEPADSLQRYTASLAAIREQAAALSGSAALRVVAIAALLGRAQADLPPFTVMPLPTVRAELPDDVRIDLVARRADLIASRWRVESAQQSRAAARAQFYPDISVNGLAALQTVRLGRLFEIGSADPQFGAAIHLPLFDSGRLRARYRGTEAALAEAVAAYRQTLVDAAREVATAAASRSQLAAEREQRQIELDAALRLRASAAARARQGLTDARDELAATEAWIEQRDAVLQLDAAALSADIGLQRALGGGYDDTKDFKTTATTVKAAP
jgi:multidrug efflux system outer membrane protein